MTKQKNSTRNSEILQSELTNNHSHTHHRDFKLSHQDAQAGSSDYESILGEEDPGSALESLVSERICE